MKILDIIIIIISLITFGIIAIVSSSIADKKWFNECMKINEEWANYCIKINQEWSDVFCKLNDSLQDRINVLEKEVIELKELEKVNVGEQNEID